MIAQALETWLKGGRAQPATADDYYKDLTTFFLFVLALCLSLAVFIYWIDLPIVEQHGFRQTQTALSAFWMARNGDWLTPWSYQTPVVGSPWQIPFEFPAYQWVVAAAASLFHTPLDATGRTVAMLAFYGCLPLIFLLWRDRQAPPRLFFLLGTLLLLSPLYLFWSRTFMIESTALLLGFAHGFFLQRFLVRKSCVSYPFAIAFGLLAILVKVTTFADFVLLDGLLLIELSTRQKQWFSSRHWVRVLFPAMLTVAIPVVAMVLWLEWTDGIKLQGLIGRSFTSQNLSPWNYGTLAQRLGAELWLKTIWQRAIPEAIGSAAGLLVLGIGFILAERRQRLAMAGLTLLFLVPFLIFTNLHIVHNYYQYAASVFLVGALGLACHVLSLRLPWKVFILLMLCLGGGQIWKFQQAYLPSLAGRMPEEAGLALARKIAQRTAPEDAIVIFGSDWSPVLPYYSGRKALAVPAFLKPADLDTILQELPQHVGGLSIAAVIINGAGFAAYSIRPEDLYRRLNQLEPSSQVEMFGNYRIYWRDPKAGVSAL